MFSILNSKHICKIDKNYNIDYRLVMEVVLHGISIGFSGLEALLALISIFFIKIAEKDSN